MRTLSSLLRYPHRHTILTTLFINMYIQVFQIIILVFSAIVHEYMHGWMADRLGDPTAKNAGRLTMNPIPHIDPFGSIMLPLILILSQSAFIIGWAKPVPFNPYNLRDSKYGSAKVAFAGPLGNLIIAVIFGLIIRIFFSSLMAFNPLLVTLFAVIVYINILLMIFNLVPIPPMDGSKILMAFLPLKLKIEYAKLENYGMWLVLLFVIFGFDLIRPIIFNLFIFLTGDQVLNLLI